MAWAHFGWMTSLHYYSSGPRALLSSLGKSICKQIVLCPASVDKVTFFSLLSTTKCFCVYKTNMANFTLKLKKKMCLGLQLNWGGFWTQKCPLFPRSVLCHPNFSFQIINSTATAKGGRARKWSETELFGSKLLGLSCHLYDCAFPTSPLSQKVSSIRSVYHHVFTVPYENRRRYVLSKRFCYYDCSSLGPIIWHYKDFCSSPFSSA